MNEPVSLDVGGTIYVTRRATLASAPDGSLLERMFARGADSRWKPPRTADGSYFFDLDPVPFGVVLNVLRHGPDALYTAAPEVLHGVGVVADYLGLDALVAECAAANAAREVAMAPKHRRRRIALVTSGSMWRDGFDLCDWNHVRHVIVLRDWTLRQVRETIADALCVAPRDVVMHECAQRLNHTIRPSEPLSVEHDGDMTFGEAEFASIGALDACLLIEEGPSVVTTERPMLILVKRFDRETVSVSRPMPIAVDPTHTVDSALSAIRARLTVEADATVFVFEEVRLNMVKAVDTTLTFGAAELEYGDILWIEVAGVTDPPSGRSAVRCRVKDKHMRFLRVPAHIPLGR